MKRKPIKLKRRYETFRHWLLSLYYLFFVKKLICMCNGHMILEFIFSLISCHLAEFLYITKIARLCMKLFLSCKRLYVKVDTFTTCFPTVMHIFMKVFELDLQGTKEN